MNDYHVVRFLVKISQRILLSRGNVFVFVVTSYGVTYLRQFRPGKEYSVPIRVPRNNPQNGRGSPTHSLPIPEGVTLVLINNDTSTSEH